MVSKTLVLSGLAAVGVAGVAAYLLIKPIQQKYAVTVQVTDQTGSAVAGAAVTLGQSLPQETNVDGITVFTDFPAGTYQLSVTAIGYQTLIESVQVSKNLTVPVVLTPNATCAPQTCPCGYYFSSTPPCGCVPQRVASLIVSPTYSFSQTWLVLRQGWWYNPFPTVCGFASTLQAPGASGCPSSSGCCRDSGHTDTIQLPLEATIKDVNGNPVCGIEVMAGLTGLQQIPWSGSCFKGVFNISLVNDTAITDENGIAVFTVKVQIAQVSCSCIDPLQDGPVSEGTPQIPFNMVFSIPNTSFEALMSLTMDAQICGYYPACSLPI